VWTAAAVPKLTMRLDVGHPRPIRPGRVDPQRRASDDVSGDRQPLGAQT